jgi:hypothetical protein
MIPSIAEYNAISSPPVPPPENRQFSSGEVVRSGAHVAYPNPAAGPAHPSSWSRALGTTRRDSDTYHKAAEENGDPDYSSNPKTTLFRARSSPRPPRMRNVSGHHLISSPVPTPLIMRRRETCLALPHTRSLGSR